MDETLHNHARDQLLQRRRRLEAVRAGEPVQVEHLINQVDAALERIEAGTYGLCRECHEPIEPERLRADPLLEFCLDHLTPHQQRALQEDIELAGRIQSALLPPPKLTLPGWFATYHYEGYGPVSGDFCDLVPAGDGGFYFFLGDVAGKGIAASILVAHLHATLRALVTMELPLPHLVERASRSLCEHTLPTHFATLVSGCARADGSVTLCNAGQVPPLFHRDGTVTPLPATGLPLGVFCDEQFTEHRLDLRPGDALLLCSDGLVEARNADGYEYGFDRFSRLAASLHPLPPTEWLEACLRDWLVFRAGAPKTDDVSLMVIGRLADPA